MKNDNRFLINARIVFFREFDKLLEITFTIPLIIFTSTIPLIIFKMTEAELQEMTMALINDDSIFDIDEPPAPMDRAKEPV